MILNLEKMFAAQKVLRDRINYNGEDRFNKLVLALLVEIGECANEWRGFKFWSKNQEPKTKAQRIKDLSAAEYELETFSPLLEEYVDGLHFVLELGIEVGCTPDECDLYFKAENVVNQFLGLYQITNQVRVGKNQRAWCYELIKIYCGLSEMLGFKWEEVEQAYFDKNQVNHQRQEEGY